MVRRTVFALTAVVFAAVAVVMGTGHTPEAAGHDPSWVAQLNVALNASAGVSLVVGLVCVRRGRIAAHRASMLTAFVLSSLFLVGYLVHHAQVGSVPFQGTGWLRTLYFSLLIPHIVLAASVVPLALLTLYRGQAGKLAAHRAIARYTLPIWLFVSVSGVAVYFMLYHT